MQSGASLANDRLVLVLLNIPPAFQPMLDVHTSCWAGEDQYCHQPSLQVGANRGVDPAQSLLCGLWQFICVLPFLEPVANGGLYFVPYEVPGSLLAFIEANQRR
jgi:hypothetical protein